MVNVLPTRHLQPRGAPAVLDLDDPEIGVSAAAALENGHRLGKPKWRRGLRHPKPFACIVMGRAGGGAEQVAGAIEVVDDHEDGARFLCTLAHHGAVQALNHAAPQEGAHPDGGFEPHRAAAQGVASSDWPLILASSAISPSLISPVSGMLRSRSKARMALRVSLLSSPVMAPGL